MNVGLTCGTYEGRYNISRRIIIGSVGVEPTKNSKTLVLGKTEKITIVTPIIKRR